MPERRGNGFKGRLVTRRRMKSRFRGFADQRSESLKPVHGRFGRGGFFAFGKTPGL
jgi:hypothetical protein